MKKVQSHSRAFTLAELMVSVSIIAILMSVLIPALSNTREVARNVRCQANLRQIGNAIRLYADDYRGKLMPMDTSADTEWYNLIRPFVGQAGYADSADESASENIGLCPSAKTPANAGAVKYSFGDAYTSWTWNFDTGSYGSNNWLRPDGDAYYNDGGFNENTLFSGRSDWFFNTLTSAEFPAETPVIADCNWVGGWPEEKGLPPDDLVAGRYGHGRQRFMARFAIIRHLERSVNVVHVDGHVDAVELGGLWRLNWHKGWDDPDPFKLP